MATNYRGAFLSMAFAWELYTFLAWAAVLIFFAPSDFRDTVITALIAGGILYGISTLNKLADPVRALELEGDRKFIATTRVVAVLVIVMVVWWVVVNQGAASELPWLGGALAALISLYLLEPMAKRKLQH